MESISMSSLMIDGTLMRENLTAVVEQQRRRPAYIVHIYYLLPECLAGNDSYKLKKLAYCQILVH